MNEQLQNASSIGNLPEVQRLLATPGIDVNAKSDDGFTALMLAAERGHAAVVQALLGAGADVNAKDNNDGRTALMLAALNGHTEVVQALLGAGADVNAKDNVGFTALMLAAEDGRAAVVQALQALLGAGADVNAKSDDGYTALMLAAERGHAAVVQALLGAGADVNAKSDDGFTALMLAASAAHAAVVQALLGAGADVNAKDRNGWTPLIIAVGVGKIESVRAMLDAGADVNAKDNDGRTALMAAAYDVDLVRALLEKGADVNVKDRSGRDAMSYATTVEIREVLEAAARGREADKPKWAGMNQGEIELFDAFFEDPINYSMCPVCLGFIQRSEACRYMHHNCVAAGNRIVHKMLYDKYNYLGNIWWCTICGRCAKSHAHYKFQIYQDPGVPVVLPRQVEQGIQGMGAFGGEQECIQEGGGGIAEKIARFDRMVAYAGELQEEVGKITKDAAMLQLIEETWNAPAFRSRRAQQILREKKWTTPKETFPAPAGPPAGAAAGPAVAAEVVKPADEAANVPEEVEVGMDALELDEVRPAIRFIHKKRDGSVNRHADDKLVGKEGLTNFIRGMNQRFGTAEFGFCYDYPDCDAKLWPQDIQPYITDPAVFEDYRAKFNRKFGAPQGGGAKPFNFMFSIQDEVSCGTEAKKQTAARRRTYRKKKKLRRMTYRK